MSREAPWQSPNPRAGYLKAVWSDLFGSVFGVWAASGGFKTIQKRRGRRPPYIFGWF